MKKERFLLIAIIGLCLCFSMGIVSHAAEVPNQTEQETEQVTEQETEQEKTTVEQPKKLTIPTKQKGVAQDNNSIKLTWSKVADADGYRIYQKVSNKWKKVADTQKTSYVHKGLKIGTKYTYTIRAYYIKDGKTSYGPYNKKGFSVKTQNVKKLTQPKNIKASSKKKGITVKWSKVSNATAYRIYRKKAGSNKWSKLIDVKNKTTYTDESVKKNTSYVYTVVALNGTVKSTYNKKGVYCVFSQDKPYVYAAKIVNKETTASMSNEQKLKACYNWYKKNKVAYRTNNENPLELSDNSWITRYATELFEKNRGNCYRHASSFAYIAATLGYKPKVVVGKVQASAGGMTPHGWVEITMNGTKYIFDERLQFAQEARGIKVNMFKVKYSGSPKYPLKISAIKSYSLPS